MGRFSSDFEKAFDKVIYLFTYLRKLISKLHTYGLHVSIINLICGSLETRKHRAKDNISYSGWNNVISGVLRGNVLGRLLFMAALCNSGAIIFLPCGYYLFSSPNLSGRRLDVYRTSTHGVALVRI